MLSMSLIKCNLPISHCLANLVLYLSIKKQYYVAKVRTIP